MGLFNKFKKKEEQIKDDIYAPGWDAITEECEKTYPNQKNPKHYGTLINWKLGGNDPLQGISVYDGGDYWHFVTYGLSELYKKESENKEISGYGMEFTFKLKKDNYEDEEAEIKGICNILQQIARITFTKGEIFKEYEYLYTGQTEGIDTKMKTNITGFITIPDTKFKTINTPNGKVNFVEFVGVTNAELKAILNKEIKVKDLYEKLGTDITNYNRNSVILNNQDSITKQNVENLNSNIAFSKVLNDVDVNECVKSGQLKWIYIISPIFGGSEERGNQIVVTPKAAKEKQFIENELQGFVAQGKIIKNFNINFEYKENSVVPSKIFISARINEENYNKIIEVW